MASHCGSAHPSLADVTCTVTGNHADHSAYVGGGLVYWDNLDCVIPEKKAPKARGGSRRRHGITGPSHAEVASVAQRIRFDDD